MEKALAFLLSCIFQSTVGLLGPAGYFVLFAVACLMAMLAGILVGSPDRRKYSLLLLLPAIWIATGLWAGYFQVSDFSSPSARLSWLVYPVNLSPIAYIGLGGFLILYLRSIWPFVVPFLLVNFYFVLVITFFGSMAITGVWL